jgi:radical SAM superfamily enzyme YgiQ (UPF0313 family)
MEKVVLVIPKDSVAADPLAYPSLGILYIAAVLDRDDFQVSIYDMREKKNIIEMIPNVDVYCFTAVTSQIRQVIYDSRYIRNVIKKFTVIGGHYASYCAEQIKNDFDAIVIGEGESVIVDIIKNRKIGIFNGLSFSKRQDIDKIPFPARYLLPKEKIVNNSISNGYGYEGNPGTTIITTRGCPRKCAFCSNTPQRVRYRDPYLVVEEIKYLIKEYSCKSFKILDDNFLLKLSHVKSICEGIKHLGIEFRCAARSDDITDEKCKILKEAGCKELAIGVEVADDKILKTMNKKETVADHKKAIKIIKDNDILVRLYLMVGLPGETQESIEKTKQFIKETNPDKFTISCFMPYAGCPIWNNPEKYGVEIERENYENYFQLYPVIDPPYRTKECNKEDIKKQHKDLLDFAKEYKNE